MSRRDGYQQVAESVPFDNDTNDFEADNLQDAIKEAKMSGHPHKNTVHVDKLGNDTTGDGTPHNPYLTIAKAITSITDNSQFNPYSIYVGSGIFVESLLTMPLYTVIKGQGASTVVMPDGNHHIFILSNRSEIKDMFILSAPSGYAGIYIDDSDSGGLIKDIVFNSCDTGIKISATANNVHVGVSNCEFITNYTKGIDIVSDNGYEAEVHAVNVYFRPTSSTTNHIIIEGSGSELELLGCEIEGIGTDTGILIKGGSLGHSTSLYLKGLALGIHVDNTAGVPHFGVSGVLYHNNTLDIKVENVNTTGVHSGYVGYLKQEIPDECPFFITNKDPKIITVYKKGGDFETITEANASITDASVSNPYIISVGAGVFQESGIELKDYVSLKGVDVSSTFIDGNNDSAHVLIPGLYSYTSFLTIQNSGTGYAGIDVSNSGFVTLMHKVAIYNCDIGIKAHATTNDLYCLLEYVDIHDIYSVALDIKTTSTYSSFVNAESFYTVPSESNIADYQVKVDGSNARINITGSNIIGNGSDDGILVTNGGYIDAVALSVWNCDNGVHLDTNGTNPKAHLVSVEFDDNTTDLNIPNTTASGFYNGYVPYSKQIISRSNDFFITSKDPNIVTVFKKGGDFDNIADAIAAIVAIQNSGEKFAIQIGPGTYSEPLLELSEDISIVSLADELVTIVPDGDHDTIHITGSQVAIYNLEIENAPSGRWAIKIDDVDADDIELINVELVDNDNNIYLRTVNYATHLDLTNVEIGGSYSKGIEIIATNSESALVSLSDVVMKSTKSGMSNPHVSLTGVGAALEAPMLRITGLDGLGGATDVGIKVLDGARYRTNGPYIRDCYIGVDCPTGGAAPDLQINSLRLDNTLDLNILHTGATGNFNGHVRYLKQIISRSNDFFVTNKDANIITVAKKGGDFTSIAAAIAAITDASSSNPYIISVGPGTYSEPTIVVPSYISIKGSSIDGTVVQPSASNHHVFQITSNVDISFLTVKNAGSGYAGIYSANSSTDVSAHKVNIIDCDLGIFCTASTQSGVFIADNINISGSFTNAVKVTTTSTYTMTFTGENFHTKNTGTASGSHVLVDGYYAECVLTTGSIIGDETDTGITNTNATLNINDFYLNELNKGLVSSGYALNTVGNVGIFRRISSSGGTAIEVYNGALLSLASTTIVACTTGILATNTGNAPTISGIANIYYCTNDVTISHTTTAGNLFGIFEKSKVTNNAPNTIQLAYQDPDTGDFNVSRILATRGFATDLTKLTVASQTTQMVSYDSHTYILSGSTTGQVLKLPDATTLREGHQFYILNESSVSVDVQDYGGTVDQTLKKETNTLKILTDNSTTAGVWTQSVGVNFAAGKLRDPRTFKSNGVVSNGEWVSQDESLSDFKYIFTEDVKLIGIEWSNGGGTSRDFDLEFYKNGTDAGDIVRTYEVRNSTDDWDSEIGWDDLFEAGDYMRVKYVDQGTNCSDFGGRFLFDVVTS